MLNMIQYDKKKKISSVLDKVRLPDRTNLIKWAESQESYTVSNYKHKLKI